MEQQTHPAEFYTPAEERANRLSHGIGILFSIAALVILVWQSVQTGDPWYVFSFALFGTTMLILYTSSTLYHTFTDEKTKLLLRKVDHSAIYLLIAGTYTPFLLISLRGPWGWIMFGIIWAFALFGIIIKVLTRIRSKWASAVIYLIMGWIGILVADKVIVLVPGKSLIFLAAGGLAYTAGVLFYVWKKLKYHHAIWHLFVLAGTLLHFFAVINLV